jgi:Ca-activated chloride channel family protein
MEVFEILARLQAPASVPASSDFDVEWEGPGERTDFLTVVRPDASEGSYRQLALVTSANPVSLRAPEAAGEWEIRYVDGATGATFGRAPLDVVAATPRLDAPAEVRAGDRFEVVWSGPDRGGDLVVVAPADAPDRRWEEFGFTAAGSPLGLAAPFRPGSYEIRYVDGTSGDVLARRPLEVR